MREFHSPKMSDMTSNFNYPRTTKLTITTKGTEDLLKKVNPMKDNGPDKIPSRALKDCIPQIAPYLTVIFNQSLTEQDHVIGPWQDLPERKGKIQLNIDLSPLRV